MDYEVIRINEKTWRIEDTGVRFFLLTGTERALLIDSGMRMPLTRSGMIMTSLKKGTVDGYIRK